LAVHTIQFGRTGIAVPKAEIKNQIRRLRFEHDEMTQQELANRVGCSRQTIVVLEQGRYVPSLALAMLIARTFGVTVEEVFKLESD
jgi:putative transcriptional regulator